MGSLIQAAVELLAEHGPDGVTASRIASHVGVTTEDVSRFFPDINSLVGLAQNRLRNSAQPPRPKRAANPFATSQSASPPPPPPAKPKPPPRRQQEPVALVLRETPEKTIEPAVRQLVGQFVAELPDFTKFDKNDQKGLFKIAFATMAKAVEQALVLHQVPDASSVAHLLTLSCHRLVKDALSKDIAQFQDGRLVLGLCQLYATYINSN